MKAQSGSTYTCIAGPVDAATALKVGGVETGCTVRRTKALVQVTALAAALVRPRARVRTRSPPSARYITGQRTTGRQHNRRRALALALSTSTRRNQVNQRTRDCISIVREERKCQGLGGKKDE